MKIKPMFRVCFPPSSKETINRCEKGSSMTDTDKEQMANGYVSEEQLATNSIYPCPFCGERNFRFYYERKFYIKNDKNQRNGKNPDELTNDSMYSRGLIMEEKVAKKKRFSKDIWYYKEVTCTTCRSSYRSNLYRKNKYAKIPSI